MYFSVLDNQDQIMFSNSTAKTFLIIYLLSNISIISYVVEAQDEKIVTKIGAIIDVNSRIGKQQKAAMEIAAESFNNKSQTHLLSLHFRDSSRDPFAAAYAAENLIKEEKVQVIIGMETWQEAITVADVVKSQNLSDDKVVPVISFAAPTITPPLIQRRWPFLIRMGSDVAAQMACIGDIVSAYYWKRVVVIYEDDGYGGGMGRLAVLSETLRNVGAKIEHRIVLPRLNGSSDRYWDEVEKQFEDSNVQSRVFIVLQSSLPTVTSLFKFAKKMKLVEAHSAWIITESIASLLDPQGNYDMEGTLGIKTYFNRSTTAYASFQKQFRTKFSDEAESNPGIYALRAYDIVSMITQAISGVSDMNTKSTNASLQMALAEKNYKGASGEMQLKGSEVVLDSTRFRIINIVNGKTDRELNFWTAEFGFSEVHAEVSDKNSDVGNVTWPGNITGQASKGWKMPTDQKKMKIAIPVQNRPFIEDKGNNQYDGFCIQLFNMVVRNLSPLYSLPHEFHRVDGNVNDLIESVFNKTYDAIVGDITMLNERIDKVEFTQPYLESGLSMIVPDISNEEETWMFLKPFTGQMWMVTGVILIYTTFVVWFLEMPSSPDLKGSFRGQVAYATWFTFSSLFFAHREKVYSNLTRIVFIVWLFVVLILSSSYTANLSSMLTIQRLSPNVTDIEMLRRTNSLVGCDNDSFVRNYLENVLDFKSENVKIIDSMYKPEEIKQMNLSAVFLELPYAQVFMDKYEAFTLTQSTYNFGGFSFVFQKGSPIIRDFSKIILDLLEKGEMRRLQNQWLTPNNRLMNATTSNMPESLSLESFWGLFVISGTTSTFCFLIALTIWLKKLYHQKRSQVI